jgi:UDP-2-acetamido-2,6-beta-L-arabino-hexul-4-ose reductase
MKIAVTGETGFLGYYLVNFLYWVKGHEVISVGRDFQQSPEKFLGVDWVIHLAGINRANTEKEVYLGNIGLAEDLINIFKKNDKCSNVIFASSIQEDFNNNYGASKKEASRKIQDFCTRHNSSFISLKIPNIFGPFCRPNYNSFIATFCNDLLKGKKPEVSVDKEVPLCYIEDVCKIIEASILKEERQYFDEYVKNITVIEVLDKLENYYSRYKLENGIIPNLKNNFDINLFNTFRSYFPPIHTLVKRDDERGYLIEVLKCEGSATQLFYSVTNPQIIRGNHFHFSKIERFMILKGDALIEMRKVGSSFIESYKVSSSDNVVLDMPVLYAHSLTNIGRHELICAFWTHEIFDPCNTDTYYEKVRK